MLYILIIGFISNSILLEKRTVRNGNGMRVIVRKMVLDPFMLGIEFVLSMMFRIARQILADVYSVRILRYRKRTPPTHVQWWIILMLVTSALYINPLILRISFS